MRQLHPQTLPPSYRHLAAAALFLAAALVLLLSCQPAFSATLPAYRFYNNQRATHFYTINGAERDQLIRGGAPFLYEGPAFSALDSPQSGATAVWRLWHAPSGSHLYTLSLSERDQAAQTPGYTLEGVAFFAFSNAAEGRVPVYRFFNRVTGAHFFTASGTEYSQVRASLPDYIDEGIRFYALPAVAAPGPAPSSYDAFRLLNQATFGATPAEVARLGQIGAAAWLEDQFAKAASGYPDSRYNFLSLDESAECSFAAAPMSDAYRCAVAQLTLFRLQADFFANALNADDQLRQRVAWALSQHFVVSGMKDPDLETAYAVSRYHNILFDEAFGDFERLLARVARSPAMGHYLDMVNNDKPDPASGRMANENFAREIMQLFTIGTIELKADGTPLTDSGGNPIPTYTQADIKTLARVFTGWTYPPTPAKHNDSSDFQHNDRYYAGEMVSYPNGHDTDPKSLFGAATLPAGQSAETDFTTAIHLLFLHPNVGPFLAKHLIHQLVTSNPSPAYVARVTAAFNDNGQGRRGDMKAVLRAVLLDAEARNDPRFNGESGLLKEPVLFVTGLLRALGVKSDGANVVEWTRAMGQRVFYSPTVFNYYPADYKIAGTTLTAPQFGIHNANTVLAREHFVWDAIYGGGLEPDDDIAEAIGTRVDLAGWTALAATPSALIDRIDQLLFGGIMDSALRGVLLDAINAVPADDPEERVRMALYIAANSYLYQVNR